MNKFSLMLFFLSLFNMDAKELGAKEIINSADEEILFSYDWRMNFELREGIYHPVLIRFSTDKSLHFINLCNDISWRYKISKNHAINVTSPQITLVGCQEEMKLIEEEIIKRTPGMKKYKINKNGNEFNLTIFFKDGGEWGLKSQKK